MVELEKYKGDELQAFLEYRERRDAPCPVPYQAPGEVRPYTTTTAVTDLVKPVAVLSGLAFGVYIAGACAVAVGSAILATVSTYAVPIGGTAAAVVCLVLCFAAGKETPPVERTKQGQGGNMVNVTVNVAGDSVNATSNGK